MALIEAVQLQMITTLEGVSSRGYWLGFVPAASIFPYPHEVDKVATFPPALEKQPGCAHTSWQLFA
jgi:hypothetical protein